MPNRSRSSSSRTTTHTQQSNGGNGHHHSHYDPSRNLLLDPRFLIQLAGIILAAAALYYGMVGKQDSLAREQARQGELLNKIENRLPNKEALDLRLEQIEKRITLNEAQVKAFDDWMRVTQVQLARREGMSNPTH